jgi:hypothetical protein
MIDAPPLYTSPGAAVAPVAIHADAAIAMHALWRMRVLKLDMSVISIIWVESACVEEAIGGALWRG